MAVVVMGVSGSGKTTVGTALAARLDVPFVDADDLHPPANRAKMAAGEPLTDDDRWPWLHDVARWLDEHPDGVTACSALRRRYRDVLRADLPAAVFVVLHGDRDLLEERVSGRAGHFMPASLLDSQLDTLEPLEPDEHGIVVDIGAPVEALVAEVADRLTEA